MPGLLQLDAEFGIELLQRAGDAVGHGACLPADTTSADVGTDVELVAQLNRQQRRIGLLGEILVGKIAIQLAPVDDEFAGALGETDAGGGRFAAAGGGKHG